MGANAALPLVSVIVPAYDAAGTIDAALSSVRAQQYRHLEILVVDDGSRDATARIVASHAAADARVRLLRQENAGVAAARNRAVMEARGEFLAPLDADDLWRADKIARQVNLMIRGRGTFGLVYGWSAFIDAKGCLAGFSRRPRDSGRVLERMCLGNLVGNGSTPLMRRDAVLACGGYDPGLRERGAEGCEDLKLYLAIAEHFEIAVVPDYLVGYRISAGNMSGDIRRMMRSYDLVTGEIACRRPWLSQSIARGRAATLAWYLERALANGHYKRAAGIIIELLGSRRLEALPLLAGPRCGIVRRRLGSAVGRRRFRSADEWLAAAHCVDAATVAATTWELSK